MYVRRQPEQSPSGSPLFKLIRSQLGIVETVLKAATLEQQQREAAEASALVDELTGLGNRRALQLAYDQLPVSHPGGHRTTDISHSIILFDLDGFKEVNDTYGHPKGDEVLQTVARTVRNYIRETDIPVRVGGDEFAILLPFAGDEKTIEIAEKLRLAIGTETDVTASIGVATIYPGEFDANYRRADAALYEAKEGGKSGYRGDQVVAYMTPAMSSY